jgi:hypothetical protein
MLMQSPLSWVTSGLCCELMEASMKRILFFSAALLAAGLSLIPDDASAQGRGGRSWSEGGGRSGGGGGGGGFGPSSAFRDGGNRGPSIGGGVGSRWDRNAVGRPAFNRPFVGERVADRRWRRHHRYVHYRPWYGGYPYWGFGAGFISGAALGYPYYGYGPDYYEPECVQVRRRVWTGRVWRVRIVTECY